LTTLSPEIVLEDRMGFEEAWFMTFS